MSDGTPEDSSNDEIGERPSVPLECGVIELDLKKQGKHPECLGDYDYWGEFDCDYGTVLTCDECKYGGGRKDPAAKCNAL